MTHKEATSQLAQTDREEGKGSRTTQALLRKQEDPTQRRLFLCGFQRTRASGAGRVLQLPLPRAHALLPPSPGSCETKQRIQAITYRSLTHVLRLQGPDRRQGQRNANAQVCRGKQRTNRKTPIKDGKAENKNKKNLTRDLHKYLVLQNKGKKQQFAKKIDESTGKR